MNKFRYATGNIAEFEADAIINSVGVETDNYGGICRSIIEANPTNEIKKVIDSTNNLYTAGELFTTPGYQLKARNIVHLICPLSKDDDKDYSLFKECIRRALNECQLRHWYRVGIPSIGTGANKYDKEKARRIIADMCYDYCECYPDMRITFVRPDDEIESKNNERLSNAFYSREYGYHSPETNAKSKKGSLILSKTKKELLVAGYTKRYFGFERYKDPKHILVKFDYSSIMCFGNYVDQYIEKCKDDIFKHKSIVIQRINLFFGYGTTGKKSYTTIGSDAYGEIKKKIDPSKKDIYKVAFALKMTIRETERLMAYYGYCFCEHGHSPMDDVVKDLITYKTYGIVEIQQAFNEKGVPSLFARK